MIYICAPLLHATNDGFYCVSFLLFRFIIDQHATDEKYRFETLQATTVINSQPLLNPLPLDLSPAMEITVKEHLDIFRKNGFDIEVQEYEDCGDLQSSEDEHPLSSHRRIRVKALPFSKNITFGADDIHELCALLNEAPGVMVRLPKVGVWQHARCTFRVAPFRFTPLMFCSAFASACPPSCR
jgi:hypothetical protein